MMGLLTSAGLSAGWFKMRCDPARTSYRNWHTLTLEGEAGEPLGFCLFSRESMAAAGKGRKRRRTSYMVRVYRVGGAGQAALFDQRVCAWGQELFFIAVDPSLR